MRSLVFCALSACAALAGGCGGSAGSATGSGSLSGVVKVNGKPLGYGRVEFHLPGGRIVKGAIGPGGAYSLFNPPTGTAKVVVIAGQPPVAAAAMGAAADPPPTFEKVDVPDRYTDPDRTPLSYTIKEGPQTYDVLVES